MLTKEIRYRDGLATFRIPAHWTIEIDPVTGGIFYDPDAASAPRLTVMTFSGPSSFNIPAPKTDRRVLHHGPADNGCHLTETEQDTVEDGEPITIRSWIFYQQRWTTVHVYAFTYTYDRDEGRQTVTAIGEAVRVMTPCPGHLGTDLCACGRINAVQIPTS